MLCFLHVCTDFLELNVSMLLEVVSSSLNWSCGVEAHLGFVEYYSDVVEAHPPGGLGAMEDHFRGIGPHVGAMEACSVAMKKDIL